MTTPKKGMMTTRKGMITQEMYEFMLKNFSQYNKGNNTSEHSDQNRKIRHTEYVSFHSISFLPYFSLPTSILQRGEFTLDEFDMIYAGGDWRLNLEYVEFIKKCIEKKYYNILFLLCVDEDRDMDNASFKEAIIDRFRHRMSGPYNTNFPRSPYSSYATIDGLFERVRLMNSWTISLLRKSRASEDTMTCLTNLLFLGSMPGRCNDLRLMKVLMCAMVKRENAPIVRAHMATNSPIPSSMLELWTDESLESTANRLKAPFRRHIKSKAEASGMIVKVFPDLTREVVVSREELHVSLEAKKEWQKKMLNEYYSMISGELSYLDNNISDIDISAFEEVLGRQVLECMNLPF